MSNHWADPKWVYPLRDNVGCFGMRREHYDALTAERDDWHKVADLRAAEIDALRSRLAEAERDAARWRFWKHNGGLLDPLLANWNPSTCTYMQWIDQCIDLLMTSPHWRHKTVRDIPAADQPTECRIFEYDGAFKCLTHKRLWGAVIAPQQPCVGWLPPKE